MVEQRRAGAQTNLNYMYSNSHGIQQDYVTAHMWYILVTSKGHKMGKNGGKFARKMPLSEIVDAKKLAKNCLV